MNIFRNISRNKKNIFNTLILLLPLFVAICAVPNQLYPFGGIKTFVFIGIMSCTTILYLYALLKRKKDITLQFNRIDLYLFIFILGMNLTSLLGVDPYLSFFGSFDRGVTVTLWCYVFLYYLVLKRLTANDPGKIETLHLGITLSGIITVIFVWISHLAIIPNTFMGGLEGNSSLSGVVILFSLASCMVFILKYYKEKKYLMMRISIVAFMFILLNPLFVVFSTQGIYLGDARGALMAGIIAIIPTFGFFLLSKGTGSKKMLGKVILVVFVVIASIITITLFKNSSITQNLFKNNGGSSRLVFWDIAFQSIKEKPFIGHGTGTFEYSFLHNFDPSLYYVNSVYEGLTDKPHNAYIEIIHDNGIILFVIYLLVLAYLYKEIYRGMLIGDKKYEYIIYFYILTAYLIQNTLAFDGTTSILLFGVLCALISRNAESIDSFSVNRKISWPIILLCLILLYQFSLLPLIEGYKMKNLVNKIPYGKKGEYSVQAFSTSKTGGIVFSGYIANRMMNHFETDTTTDYSIDIKNFMEALENEPTMDKSIPRHTFMVRGYIYLYKKTKSPIYLLEAEKSALFIKEHAHLYPEGYWLLTHVYYLQGKPRDSMIAAKTIINIDPKIRESYDRMIMLTRTIGAKDIEEKVLKEALINFPDYE